MEEVGNDGDGADKVVDVESESDEVSADASLPTNLPVPAKQYGFTAITRLLFEKYFKVVEEIENGQLRVKCLNCKSETTASETMTSNLTRHLVSLSLE